MYLIPGDSPMGLRLPLDCPALGERCRQDPRRARSHGPARNPARVAGSGRRYSERAAADERRASLPYLGLRQMQGKARVARRTDWSMATSDSSPSGRRRRDEPLSHERRPHPRATNRPKA